MTTPNIIALASLPLDPRVVDLVDSLQRACGGPLLVQVDAALASDRVEHGWEGPSAPLIRLPLEADHPLRVVGPLLWLSLDVEGFPVHAHGADPVARELAILASYHVAWSEAAKRGVSPDVYLPGHASTLLWATAAAIEQNHGMPNSANARLIGAFSLSPGCRVQGVRWDLVRAFMLRDLGRDFVNAVEFALNIAGKGPSEFRSAVGILCREFGVPLPELRNIAQRCTRPVALMLPQRIYGFVNGVLATTHPNAKGRAFRVNDLVRLIDHHRQRPLMYFNHDMSRPPVLRVVNAHLHCGGEHHEVHARMAILTREHGEMLQAGQLRGFSSGIILQEESA